MAIKETRKLPDTEPKFFYGYIIVIAAFMIQVMMVGSLSSFGVFFKPLISEFGWTRALISGAYSISSILSGLLGIVMGGLNDRFGPRAVMTFCSFFVGLGYILLSQISAAWQLYLFYVVIIGIGMGGVYVPPMSTVARWFVEKRSLMTGIVSAGAGIGRIILPPAVNWLISTYSWRNSYIIMGILIAVIIIIAAQFLKRDPSQMGQVPYGENKRGKKELNLIAEGLSRKEATGTKQFWMAVAMLFCFGFCSSTIIVHIVPHITDLGISATAAANALAVTGGGMLLGGVALGILADRIGVIQTYTVCFILTSAAIFWMLPATDMWMFYLFAITFGFGSGGCATLASPLAAKLFGMKSHGLILGFIGFSNTIGVAVGPFIAGYVFDMSGHYQLAFLVTAIISMAGLALAVALRLIKKPDF